MNHLLREPFWFAVPDATDNYGQPIYSPPRRAMGRIERSQKRTLNRYGQEVISTAQVHTAQPVPGQAVVWLEPEQVGRLEAAQNVVNVVEHRGLGNNRPLVVVFL